MENTTKSLISQLCSQSTMFLMICAGLSFAFLIVFETEFYYVYFSNRFAPPLAWAVGGFMAFMVGCFRFAFLLSSAYDAQNGKWMAFLLGGIVSIALVFYELTVCEEIGAHWSVDNDFYTMKFKFLVIIGLIAEIRLCMLIFGETKEKEKKQSSILTFGGMQNIFNSQNQNLNQNQNQPT
jgi:hypothetical protein